MVSTVAGVRLTKVILYLETLKQFGAHSEIIPLKKEKYGKEGRLTPFGWLSKSGWLIKMTFGRKIEGVSGLKALKIYTSKLKKKFGDKAFRYFNMVDMKFLIKRVK